MTLNPYATFLQIGEDTHAIIAETPKTLADLLAILGTEKAEAPLDPGKWSPREVVAHLADCELMFGARLRQALADPGSTLLPFDQDVYAERYAAYDLATAHATFNAIRAWNLALLTTVSAEDRSKEVTHPERGTMTFWTIVETMAGHDRNHLLRLQSFAEQPAS
ncbi:DinB family protein [Terriglobus saanensis]|uniref:DinB-like domain-containing protein n=1 Tax=Terriglobus saanensis (strain ATCC BAA-1853 / DSM 23119 / SP1PR4) TaxID=401053 RepID=E8V304_TERSS|nr:DinB family protein [Terriglobus saanensis]ADV81279.1 hypothetical protein AciPR4_0444 [Terriglobus saanensis SP1PR4]